MNVETIQISQLSPDPGNVRRHSERNIEAVKASLRRFGQQIPLVVDASNVVRVGNCRLEAMKQLGWQTAQVVRTDLSGADLVAYAVADNRSGDPDIGSTFDNDALASVLSALQSEDATLVDAAGFTIEDLAKLTGAGPEPEAPAPPDDFQTFGDDIPTDHQCPKCGYRWSGSTQASGGEHAQA